MKRDVCSAVNSDVHACNSGNSDNESHQWCLLQIMQISIK